MGRVDVALCLLELKLKVVIAVSERPLPCADIEFSSRSEAAVVIRVSVLQLDGILNQPAFPAAKRDDVAGWVIQLVHERSHGVAKSHAVWNVDESEARSALQIGYELGGSGSGGIQLYAAMRNF